MESLILMALLLGMIVPVYGDNPTKALDPITLTIPAIDVQAPIVLAPLRAVSGVTTWDFSTLNAEIGFLEHTAWFGQGSNVVLGGHSEDIQRRPSVFYALHQLTEGDHIVINNAGVKHIYIVSDVFEVEADNLSILYPTETEQLTLITCDVDSYNAGDYDRRVVVIAERH